MNEQESALIILLGILVPALSGIILALIKKSHDLTLKKTPSGDSAFNNLKEEVSELKDEIEKQHIKIDDISERLAWLEGRNDKKRK